LIGQPTRDKIAALRIFVAFALSSSVSFLSFSFLFKISVAKNLSSFDVQAGHLTFKVINHSKFKVVQQSFDVQAGPENI
jgi:hypothetical protein